MAAPTKLTALRIPLSDVREATNNFHEDNIIGEGGFGPIYKGQLLQSGKMIKIAARRLDCSCEGFGDVEFWTEVSALSDLKHPNLVSMIGYCDEEGEKIIITKHEAKGSLAQYLKNPDLTWGQRLRIGLGVARALSYLQSDKGRDYALIHLNVNSYTILLDENWEAKLSGFEISIKRSVNLLDSVVLFEPIGEIGYIDPAIEKTRGVTYKSDIYSLGVVLFELLYGKLANMQDEADRFLRPLFTYYCSYSMLQDKIHPDMWNQMSQRSFDKYSKIAHDCIERERAHRPELDRIVGELQKALEFQLLRENLEKNSEFLKIPLADIKLATENFSKRYSFGRAGEFTCYRAELHHFDKENHSITEGRDNPRHNTIIIIRIHDEYYVKEELFFTEVKMLTSVKHHNVVNLLGYCIQASEMMLIIEDLSNGFLGDCFEDVNKKHFLTWEKRLKISIDVARTLNDIYSKMEDKNEVIRCNMSSKTIALDDNWRAKIVHFGPWGVTSKSKRENDVYLFGILLFGILFGRPVYDSDALDYSRARLAHEAMRCFRMETLEEMVDPIIKEEMGKHNFIQSRGHGKASLNTFIKIAYKCVIENEDKRPTMEVILKELEKALAYQEEQGQHQAMDLDVDGFEKTLELNITHEDSEEPGLSLDMDLVVDEREKASDFNVMHEISEKQSQHREMEQIVNKFDKASGHQLMHEILGKNSELVKVSFADIKLATEDFDFKYIFSWDTYYTLYRVKLHHFDKENHSPMKEKNNDQIPQKHDFVVLKRFHPHQNQGGAFYTELKMRATIRHRNIVTLLGFCVEDDEKLLVMEDLSTMYLHHYISAKRSYFPWEKRLKICIDVAHALNYLHFEMEEQKVIATHNINSRSIALYENFGAKFINFELFVFSPPNQEGEAPYIDISSGSPYYIDPEYKKTGRLNRASDVYSFGVLLFEILCGWRHVNEGLVSEVRRCFEMGKLDEMIDPRIRKETGANTFILSKGPSKDSVDMYIAIASRCVAETQDQRPTMKIVVEELENALFLQRNNKDNPVMSLEDIKVATRDFDHKNYIGGGGFGKVYVGKLQDGDRFITIVAKRLYGQGKQQFLNELQILLEYRHENVISLVGYCDEEDEKIIVYEYASRSSLDRYLNDASLTWLKRLNICIEIASALDFLHGGAGKQAKVVHRDIKTANILLNHDWKAKLADFGLSLISAITKETDYVIDRACGTPGYVDPLYLKSKFLTVESDIYSFGVVLFELLCGRSTHSIFKQEGHDLAAFVKNKFEEGKHEEVVFEKIRQQIVPKSLITFQEVAYRCLHHKREERPTTKEVLMQLKTALKFQTSG